MLMKLWNVWFIFVLLMFFLGDFDPTKKNGVFLATLSPSIT